jgi:TonB-linked SusC/RagA family outer membrane protein
MMMTKYTLYGVIIQCLFLSMLIAKSGTAQKLQSVKDVKISVQLQDDDLVSAFGKIEAVTDFRFAFRQSDFSPAVKLSGKYHNESLYNILLDISKQSKLQFKQVNRNINVKKPASRAIQRTVEIVIDGVTISGTIKSGEDMEGLPGVNVIVQGTNTGTVTDLNGTFTIDVPGPESVLVFSSIGFITEEVIVGQRQVINLTMSPDITSLSEIVVIGYGTVQKRDLTGSVSSVNSEEIERVPVLGLDQALQGRAAGVYVANNNANPGGAVNIRIRGTNSIQGNNEPLYIIDGYIGGNINTVDPNDIESMDVLKDASSTAIYGSRGANGVVIVTTKSGVRGQNEVSFNSFYGFQSVANKIDLMEADDYAGFINSIDEDRGDPLTYPDLSSIDTNTDWQDEILRVAPWQNYNLSAGGGTDKLGYYLSGTYVNQQGIVKETGYKRYNIRANIDAKLSDRFTIGSRLGFARVDRTRQQGEEFGGISNIFHPVSMALLLPPTRSPRGEDGELLSYIIDDQGSARENPLYHLENVNNSMFTTNFTGNVFAEIKLLKPLSFRSSIGFNINNTKMNRYKPSHVFESNDGNRNRADIDTRFSSGWLNENYFTVDKSFGIHQLQATAGITLQGNSYERLNTVVYDFAVDDFEYHNISAGTTIDTYNSDMNEWNQVSFFGRLHYILNDKYLFTLNGRYDGNSKFGTDYKYGFFPSGAFAWRLSDEEFVEQLNFFTDLKLRASYGVSGSEALGPYNSLSAMNSNSQAYNIGGVPVVGYWLNRLPNPELRWEKTSQLDIGMDFSILEGRIGVVMDYFEKTTEDLFLNRPLPQTSGVSSIRQNIGSIKNTGFEFGINATPVAGEFKWNVSANATIQDSEVLDLGGDEELITGNFGGSLKIGQMQIMRVGEPLGSFFGYQTNGTWDTDDDLDAYTQFGSQVEPGDVKLIDANEDGDVNANDRRIVGQAQPRFYGGFNNFFTYKNFDLSVFFQWSTGANVLNATRHNLWNPGNTSSKHVALKDAWTEQNMDTDIPRAGTLLPKVIYDTYVEDASFMRLREVTLGYSLPKALSERLSMSSLRLYVTGTNLLTFTEYSGYDPEVNIAGGSINVISTDNGSYPRARTFIVGLNLTF